MEQKITREVITTSVTHATEEERALGADFNRVARKALACAEIYLEYGPEDARLAITRQFLSSVARLSAADSRTEIETHRIAFEEELRKMTAVTPLEPLVTSTGPVDPETHAALPAPAALATVDQDDGT